MAAGKAQEVSFGQRLKAAEVLWGWKPHPGQIRVFASKATNKTVVCGRRWGKTESGAVDDTTSLILIPGFGCMVVAPSRDQVMINYKEAKQLLEAIPDLKGAWKCKETPHPEITLGDRYILYRTAGDDGKYIRGHGKKIRRIRVDEAAYVKQNVLEGVIEPMCLDTGAELILQGTPFGKNNFYTRYREGCPDDERYDGASESFHFPTNSNPFLDKRAYERIKHRLGEDSLQWKCEYLAEFVDSSSAVFSWDLIESCLYDLGDETFGSYYCGIDLARYSDYTVFSVAGFDRGRVSLLDMDRFNLLDWTALKARLYDDIKRWQARGTILGAIDATGEGDPVVDDMIAGEWVGDVDGKVLHREGVPLQKVRIESNAIKRELIDKLKVRMAQGLARIPYPAADVETGDDRWHTFVDELKYYTYTLSDAGRVKFAADAGYHDDCVMSLALLVSRAFGQFETNPARETHAPDTWGHVMDELRAQEQAATQMHIAPQYASWRH
jgi:hypothetical protein